ncbi:MAG: hypothetical protein FWC50_14925 [Planctomycetaceae bacterium]|nr:hypothetical protein [Planctomycetaceae bacterium]
MIKKSNEPTFFRSQKGKWLLRGAIVLAILLLLVLFAYLAARKKPGFYREFEKLSASERKKLNDALVTQSLKTYSQMQDSDQWSWFVSDKEINGWFSVDGRTQTFNFLPREIRNPRVAIRDQTIEIAAEVKYGYLSGTLCLTGSVSVPEPNLIAIRIRSARVGLFPFDKDKLAQIIREAAKSADGLQLIDEGGDPCLQFRPVMQNQKKQPLEIESVETSKNQLLVKGRKAKK